MKATISNNGVKHTFDTDASTVVSHASHGAYGDPAGYEETLYRSPSRRYFIHGVGGVDSPYPVERIVPTTKSNGLKQVPLTEE